MRSWCGAGCSRGVSAASTTWIRLRSTRVLLARLAFDDLAHEPAQTARALVDIQRRLEQAPNVESVGLSTVVPLSLENEEFDVVLDGSTAGSQRLRVMANRLTPGWFETVRIPLLAGRDFTWEDRPGAPDVAILNETFAEAVSNGTAVGQRLRVFDRDVQVVGVARDSKYWTLGETSQPTIYLPFQQHYFRYVTFHVRTRIRPPPRRCSPPTCGGSRPTCSSTCPP